MCQAFVILASNIFCNYIFIFRAWMPRGCCLAFVSLLAFFNRLFADFWLMLLVGWFLAVCNCFDILLCSL